MRATPLLSPPCASSASRAAPVAGHGGGSRKAKAQAGARERAWATIGVSASTLREREMPSTLGASGGPALFQRSLRRDGAGEMGPKSGLANKSAAGTPLANLGSGRASALPAPSSAMGRAPGPGAGRPDPGPAGATPESSAARHEKRGARGADARSKIPQLSASGGARSSGRSVGPSGGRPAPRPGEASPSRASVGETRSQKRESHGRRRGLEQTRTTRSGPNNPHGRHQLGLHQRWPPGHALGSPLPCCTSLALARRRAPHGRLSRHPAPR